MEYDMLKGTLPQKLNDNNYLTWTRWIRSILVARGHWKVVDRTYPKPVTILVDSKEMQGSKDAMEKWEAVNRKAWTDIVSVCN